MAMSKNVIVASHRRSGTHLTIDSIVNNFNCLNGNNIKTIDHLSDHDPKNNMTVDDLNKSLKGSNSILKTHSTAYIDNYFIGDRITTDYINRLFSESKIIYVYRDGRDVLVSLYNYMKSFNLDIKDTSFKEFIRMENKFDCKGYSGVMNRVEYWKYHVDSWRNDTNCLLLSFDEMRFEYHSTLEKISKFIEVPVNEDVVDVRRTGSGNNSTFIDKAKEKLKKTLSRKSISSINYRQGKSGSWEDYFDSDDLKFYSNTVGELLKW